LQNGLDGSISLKVLAKIDFARIGSSGRFSRSELPRPAKIELICPSPTGQVVDFGGVKWARPHHVYRNVPVPA
jgi:hypothetical protein